MAGQEGPDAALNEAGGVSPSPISSSSEATDVDIVMEFSEYLDHAITNAGGMASTKEKGLSTSTTTSNTATSTVFCRNKHIPQVRQGHRWREFQDGCGHCSWGRRYPDRRPPLSLRPLPNIMMRVLTEDVDEQGNDAIRRLKSMFSARNTDRFAAPWSDVA